MPTIASCTATALTVHIIERWWFISSINKLEDRKVRLEAERDLLQAEVSKKEADIDELRKTSGSFSSVEAARMANAVAGL